MIRALSLTTTLAAILALAPLSPALAQDAAPAPGSAEARLEAAAKAFEQRMEGFSAQAEAISEDENLSEEVKGLRINALWAERQPDVSAFTAQATALAGQIAAEALAQIDVDALVREAIDSPEVRQAVEGGVAAGAGIATNSAWTNPDPEQIQTYGLIAQYALDQAEVAVTDAEAAEEDAGETP